LTPQLKYITDIVIKLKAKLSKIKAEVKEVKKAIVGNLSFLNQQDKT